MKNFMAPIPPRRSWDRNGGDSGDKQNHHEDDNEISYNGHRRRRSPSPNRYRPVQLKREQEVEVDITMRGLWQAKGRYERLMKNAMVGSGYRKDNGEAVVVRYNRNDDHDD